MSATPSNAPPFRSRTLLFLSHRDSRAPTSRFSRTRQTLYDDNDLDGSENERLMSPGHVAIDVDLPPKWCVSPSP